MANISVEAQNARIKRSMRNDRIATGILTLIVGLVMLIVVSMVIYILAQGIGQLFQPGFLTEASRSNGTEGGIAYQLFDSFYLLILTLIISLPISLGGHHIQTICYLVQRFFIHEKQPPWRSFYFYYFTLFQDRQGKF